MIRNTTIIIAKRYTMLLKKHDIPVISAWLFGSFANGSSNDQSLIHIALVIEKFEDTPEYTRLLNQLCSEIDSRIKPHSFDKTDFKEGNPCFEMIMKTGISLT